MTNEEAIKTLNTLYSEDVYVNDALDLAIKALEERPQGEWMYNDYGNECGNWHCSKCGHMPYYATKYMRFLNYCPNCGADMRGEHGTENVR